jgi:hypothetical protein
MTFEIIAEINQILILKFDFIFTKLVNGGPSKDSYKWSSYKFGHTKFLVVAAMSE